MPSHFLTLTPSISSLHPHHPPTYASPYTYAHERILWKSNKNRIFYILLDFYFSYAFEMREFPYLLRARCLIITRMFVSACETPRAKISDACWNAASIQIENSFSSSLYFFFCVCQTWEVRGFENQPQRNETYHVHVVHFG